MSRKPKLALCGIQPYIHQEREHANLPPRVLRMTSLLNSRTKKKNKLPAFRGEGSAVGPLLAARALPLRCAASTVLTIYTGYA
jgi:hypothetical protein